MIRSVTAILLLLFVNPALPSTPSLPFQEAQSNTQAQELAEADKLTQTAVSLYSAGKYDEAFPHAERIVKIRQRWLGQEDDLLLSAILNLGVIQLARGKTSDAKGLLEKVLKAYEQVSGADAPKLGGVLDLLGVAYYRLGDAANAERAFVRALAIRDKTREAHHPDIVRSLSSLANFYQLEGEFKKAEPLYQRLVELRKKQGAPESIAEALERHACVLRKTNRIQDAEALETEALALTHRGANSQLQSADVLNGKALFLAQPPYPREAREQRASGKVRVRVLINESGKVILACAIEGPRQLHQASESAAYQSRFSPPPVGASLKVGILIYNFVVQ